MLQILKSNFIQVARIAALSALMISACAVKHPPPPVEIQKDAMTGIAVPNTWQAPGANGETVQDNWLASFGDPELDALVKEAIANNLDLRVGATRVEQAAAYVDIAKAALRPAVNVLGRGSAKGGSDLGSGLSGAILSASWELDLWGRLRYARNAAQENYLSAQADYEFARQSIGAMTARSWFTATETLLERQLGEEMVRYSDQVVDLAHTRLDVGVGDEQDLVMAQASVSTYQDAVEQVQLAHEQTLRALEVLLGRYPAAELKARLDLPNLPATIPSGLPLQILERRPDLIAAERRVAAAFNRIGEAKAARLPAITLSANFGAITSDVLQLQSDFENPSRGWGASLLAPIYNGGALQTKVEIRTLEQKQAVAEYAQMALRALSDVENALAAVQTLEEREKILMLTVDQNQRVLDLEQITYKVGKTDLRGVLQRQLALYAARVTLIRVQSEQLIQRINLHLALGGSFEMPAVPTTGNTTQNSKPVGGEADQRK
jgi:outer membrane protein, multidrug efflux system